MQCEKVEKHGALRRWERLRARLIPEARFNDRRATLLLI